MKRINFTIRTFYIKAKSWEYWPMWLVYFPASVYFIYLSLKARSFFFFSAANPSIETGGMFFESKWSIFQLIPKEYYPATILIAAAAPVETIVAQMSEHNISFPIIAKPDRGERGWCVKKITSLHELSAYSKAVKVSFLIQEYINYPLEFSIFYYRHPKSDKGSITSVTLKKLLAVTGDGISTIQQLIKAGDRSFLQYHRLKAEGNINFDTVPEKGQVQELVPYGNHVLGAMFVNYNHIIDEALINTFNNISTKIRGFYFGRFDLRCTSIEDLKQGKNIALLELNGSGAEPAHIYTPGFSYFRAQSIITQHYKMMYDAALENKRAGIPFMSLKAFTDTRRLQRNYKKLVNG